MTEYRKTFRHWVICCWRVIFVGVLTITHIAVITFLLEDAGKSDVASVYHGCVMALSSSVLTYWFYENIARYWQEYDNQEERKWNSRKNKTESWCR